MQSYSSAVVVDAAHHLAFRESIAESVVQLIANKHTAGHTASEIAEHLAAHVGDVGGAAFVRRVTGQLNT